MYPSIRFRPRSDGKFSTKKLYCFIRLNGCLATRFSTNIECLYNFDLKRQTFTGSKKEVDLLNQQVVRVRTEIRVIYEKLCDLQKSTTAQILRDSYLLEKERQTIHIPTTLQLFQTYINERDEKENLEEGTIEKLYIAKKHLERFLQTTYNRKDIELQTIKGSHGKAFFEYLQSLHNSKKVAVTYEHCFRVYQTFKNALEFAKSKKFIIENPFDNIGIERKKQIIKVLPMDEIDVIKLYNCEGCTNTERNIIDGFVLMCYTGLRHSDYEIFCNNPLDYIFSDESGFHFIEIYSFKNRKDKEQESSYIPLHQTVVDILEKHNYLIPTYSDQVINEYIKKIAKRVKIIKPSNITTYTARKTCACIFGNMDGIEPKSVSKILGHKHVSTTEKYYFRVNKETVKRQYLKSTTKKGSVS